MWYRKNYTIYYNHCIHADTPIIREWHKELNTCPTFVDKSEFKNKLLKILQEEGFNIDE